MTGDTAGGWFTPEIEALILRGMAGDRDAVWALLEMHQSWIKDCCVYKYRVHSSTVDDVVSATTAKAAEPKTWKGLREPPFFRWWLGLIVHDEARKARTTGDNGRADSYAEIEPMMGVSSGEKDIELAIDVILLYEALAELDPVARRILILRSEGHSYRKIRRTLKKQNGLKMTEKAIRSSAYRARQALYRLLKDGDES